MTNEEARNGGRSVLGDSRAWRAEEGPPQTHVPRDVLCDPPPLYSAPVMFHDEQQARHTLRGNSEPTPAPLVSSGSRPTFLSILSQATVSLIVYCRPKNQVSRSPRVRHTKSNRSFPFHFICKGRNPQGKLAEPESQSAHRKNPFLCAPRSQVPKGGDDAEMADEHRIPK